MITNTLFEKSKTDSEKLDELVEKLSCQAYRAKNLDDLTAEIKLLFDNLSTDDLTTALCQELKQENVSNGNNLFWLFTTFKIVIQNEKLSDVEHVQSILIKFFDTINSEVNSNQLINALTKGFTLPDYVYSQELTVPVDTLLSIDVKSKCKCGALFNSLGQAIKKSSSNDACLLQNKMKKSQGEMNSAETLEMESLDSGSVGPEGSSRESSQERGPSCC